MKDILDFKFKIPPNIYQSIFHTMVTLLTDRLDLAKDFLVTKALQVLETLVEAQNAGETLNESKAFDGPVTLYIKWSLTLVREKGNPQQQQQNGVASESGTERFSLTTPEVHLLSLKVLQ